MIANWSFWMRDRIRRTETKNDPTHRTVKSTKSMNSKFASLARIACLIVVFVSRSALGQQEDRLNKWWAEIELQRKAERVVLASRAATVIGHGADRLRERRTQLENELTYVQTKFQMAVRQLKASQDLGANPAFTDGFDREATGWDIRRKAVENELKTVEGELREWQSVLPVEKRSP
jgi:hypothetical protein